MTTATVNSTEDAALLHRGFLRMLGFISMWM